MNTLRLSSLSSVRLVLALTAGLAVSAVNSRAQIFASAQITAAPLGGGVYNYTLALDNTGSSPLETFWFAWDAYYNYDFMSVSPTSITDPSGWGYAVTYNYYYGGYGIEFSTSTTPLAGGSTIDFGFNSTETPTQMMGTYLGYPVGTSYVSTGPGFSGTSFGPFTAEVIPEPSSLALFATAFLGFWAARCNKRRK